MSIGTTLSTLRTMLRAEIGQTMDTSMNTAEDSRDNQILRDVQQWYADSHDWPHLQDWWEIAVPAGDPGRYQTLPTTDSQNRSYTINKLRPWTAKVLFSQRYLDVEFGISEKEYNVWNSNLTPSLKADPIRKIDLDALDTRIEIWPVPVSAQILRLSGQRNTGALTANSDTCDIDDLLLVKTAAFELLTQLESPRAQTVGQAAQARFLLVRSSQPQRDERLVLGQSRMRSRYSYRRIVPIAVAP